MKKSDQIHTVPEQGRHYRMMDLPPSQRPYEKCLKDGPGILSDSELLAVILRSGTKDASSLTLAHEILNHTEKTSFPGLLGILHMSLPELMKINGIGKVKAIQLKCIGELSKRMAREAARPQLSLNSPDTIAKYYMEQLRHEEQELLLCMMFDTRSHLLGEEILSKGTVNSTVITPREVYLAALKYHATCIVLVHNHPSGVTEPSAGDIQTTQRILRAGEMLGITLLDHIIIGDHTYTSLREIGMME